MIDQKIFDSAAKALGIERWPDRGERIRYRQKYKNDWQEGEVKLVWCGIEVAIDIVDGPTLYLGLGDEIICE